VPERDIRKDKSDLLPFNPSIFFVDIVIPISFLFFHIWLMVAGNNSTAKRGSTDCGRVFICEAPIYCSTCALLLYLYVLLAFGKWKAREKDVLFARRIVIESRCTI